MSHICPIFSHETSSPFLRGTQKSVDFMLFPLGTFGNSPRKSPSKSQTPSRPSTPHFRQPRWLTALLSPEGVEAQRRLDNAQAWPATWGVGYFWVRQTAKNPGES